MSTLTAPAIPTPVRFAKAPADRLFAVAWVLVALGLFAWVLALRPVWASKAELADRFLIPLASVWLVWRAAPRLRALTPMPNWWGIVPLTFGSAAFALGWYVVVQVSGRPIVVWWLTGSIILTVLGMTVAHLGRFHAAILLFPLAFIFFSLPMPGRVNNPLQLRLKEFTTSAAEKVLPYFVERVDRDGFNLRLKSGDLGVVDACSGVRSVTALTAIAVLVAYLRGFGIFRAAWLIGLTIPVIAITNAIRVIVTGVLQEHVGRTAVEGWSHETLGIGVILVGLGLIVGISSLIAPRNSKPTPPPGPPVSIALYGPGYTARSIAALALLLPPLSVCLWSEQFRVDHTVYFRATELPLKLGHWTGVDLPVNEMIAEELQCDQVMFRSYRDELGQEVTIWVMFWGNAATTAHMHHPDICYPWRNWTQTEKWVRAIPLPSGEELPVSVRHYIKPEMQQILHFWTQHGSHVLPDGIEKPELFSGHTWLFDLFQHGHRPVDQGARISVLIGTQTRGSVEKGDKLLSGFTKDFATALYEKFDWAAPKRE